MPVYNPKSGGKFSKVAKAQGCDGCGCICPKGSRMLIWSVWRDGYRHRLRFCDRCAEVVYGCSERRPVDFDDELMVRDICECCDSFPFCEKVEYLRREPPGELYFGGLELSKETP